MPPFGIVVGVGAIKGVHVPHAEGIVPFYPVVLEVLQELVSIVKCWSFTLQPLPSHPSQMSKKIFSWELTSWEVDLVGVDLVGVDFVGVDLVGGHRRDGIRQNGIRRNGMTPSRVS